MASTGLRSRAYPAVLDWLRYSCAFLLYMYGWSKLAHLQFNLSSRLAPRPIGSLSGYELTWFYYGYSREYAVILGSIQLVCATLLLFRKTTFLAAVLTFPMAANILLINAFILVNDYGPYLTSSFICFSMLAILWHQRRRLVGIAWNEQSAEPEESRTFHRRLRIAIVSVVVIMISSAAMLQHGKTP
jgi:uncharacterized membrane protein YphA (DoxX/SURF4 family)